MLAISTSTRFALPLQVLSIFTIFLFVLTIFGSQLFFRDPTSVFFRPQSAAQHDYSEYRQTQAHQFIDRAILEPQAKVAQNATPELCVGIATVAREGARYFRDTVGSLLEGLDNKERSKMHLVLFVAHSDPRKHPAFNELWMSHVADTLLGYDFTSMEFRDRILSLEAEKGLYLEKGIVDYTHLLRACGDTGAKYTVILEDDVLAQDGWMHRSLQALKIAEQKTKDLGKEQFLYLRLFFTETFFGWNSEEWQTYLANSVKTAVVVLAILLVCRFMFSADPLISKYLTNDMMLVYLFMILPVSILFVFAAGRVSLFPLAHGVNLMPNFGCCSQAMVYPQSRVFELADYLQDRRVGFVDQCVEDYARDKKELQWALVPSVFQHIGSRSTKADQGTVTQWIFNYNFERLDPELLRKEHDFALGMDA